MKVTNPPFTLMIAVSQHLSNTSSSRVRLFVSLYLFCMDKVEVVRELSGSVRVLKKPGGGKMRIQSLRFFSCWCAFQVRTEQSGRKGG